MIPCPLCGGRGIELGVLGDLTHIRCRDCGGDFSTERIGHSTLSTFLGKKGKCNNLECLCKKGCD